MPTLWTDTIATHRRRVRDAILETAAALASERGVLAVSMSQIAERAGIGRATLYKYFAGVEEILHAWHDRQVRTHLDHLSAIHDGSGPARDRLTACLQAYAHIQAQRHRHTSGPHRSELAAFVHRDEHVAPAVRELHALLRDLLAEAAAAGDIRGDIPAAELAAFCLHALDAAHDLPANAAVHRLTRLIDDALRSPA